MKTHLELTSSLVRAATVATYLSALLGFGACWCWWVFQPRAFFGFRSTAFLQPRHWPLRLSVHLTGSSESALRQLVPPQLVHQISDQLSSALTPLPGAACRYEWEVRVVPTLLPTDSLRAGEVLGGARDGGASALARILAMPAGRRDSANRGIHVVVRLAQEGAASCGCTPVVLGGLQGDGRPTGWAAIVAADAAATAECMLNGSGSIIATLASALQRQLVSRSCSLARLSDGSPRDGSPHDGSSRGGSFREPLRPPGRVGLSLLSAEAPLPQLRAARLAQLRALRRRAERLMALSWPWCPPQLHSQTVHFVDWRRAGLAPSDVSVRMGPLTGGGVRLVPTATATRVLLCGAGPRCAGGSPATLGADEPLRLLFLAPTRSELPVGLADRRGQPLPEGSSLVMAGVGALSIWLEPPLARNAFSGRNASEGGEAAAGGAETGGAEGVVAPPHVLGRAIDSQLRQLMGLPAAPQPTAPAVVNFLPCSAARLGSSRSRRHTAPDGATWATDALSEASAVSISALEIAALQAGCARALLAELEFDLPALLLMQRRHHRTALQEGRDADELVAHAAEAERLAGRAGRWASRGRYTQACAAAVAARVQARAALRHTAYLPTAYFSEDPTINVFAPLFLPIASAVGAAAVHEGRSWWQRRRRHSVRAHGERRG